MINLKFSIRFAIISLCFIENVAPLSAKCNYTSNIFGHYECILTLSDVDESTEITGQHMSGRSDESVKGIEARETDDGSTIIPILCQKFKNVWSMTMDDIGIEVITENSFKNCEKLKILSLVDNEVEELPKNSFTSLVNLKILWLHYNKLAELDEKLFVNLVNLEKLSLSGNQIQTLPDEIFASLINLQELYLDHNKLMALEYSWFGDGVDKLKIFLFNNNQVTSIDKRIIDNNSNLMEIWARSNPCVKTRNEIIKDKEAARPNIMAALEDCFNN